MEIHKPKPTHSLREFLTEIGTIICGILIALGLEQGLEWAHWRHQVEQADKAVSEEVRYNLVQEYERIALRVCLSNRIGELRDRLLQPTTTDPSDAELSDNRCHDNTQAGIVVFSSKASVRANECWANGVCGISIQRDSKSLTAPSDAELIGRRT
jgi:hypothetical protein